MASPTKGFPPSKFRLLQEAASRVDSVASTAPGSTRIIQGMAAPKRWMKLDAQGVVSYIKVPRVFMILIRVEEIAHILGIASDCDMFFLGRQALNEQRIGNPLPGPAVAGP